MFNISPYGNIIKVTTKRLTTNDAAIGEAQVALLAIQTAASCGVNSLVIEGDGGMPLM